VRVLAMTHAYVPYTGAGAETTAHDLLRAVAAAGHHVDVLLSENRGPAQPYEVDGVHVHPHCDTGDPFRWFGTAHEPDVVVSQLQDTTRAAVLAQMHHVPHVHLIHNDMWHTRHAIQRGPSDLVVYNTQWVADEVSRWLLFVADQTPPRSIVVHPPVRPEQYRTAGPGDRITQVNLFTGTKGPDLFYAMARRFPDRQFLGVMGAYGQQDIRDLPNVELVGPFEPEQMAEQVYARTKVLLMPSTYESYGRAAVEACCAGLPVIAARTPGLLEALGEHGTCIDRGDVDAWETELRKLLSPRGWAAAAKRARLIADGLDTEGDLARWVETLESVARKVRVSH
jgi:glycosyltransferase involved in cell wall biosynthesis